MEESVFIVICIINVICAFIAGRINSSKGHSYMLGFLEGLFVGVFGVLVHHGINKAMVR